MGITPADKGEGRGGGGRRCQQEKGNGRLLRTVGWRDWLLPGRLDAVDTKRLSSCDGEKWRSLVEKNDKGDVGE